MDRKQQISNAGIEFQNRIFKHWDILKESFISGAKWADDNPSDELLDKIIYYLDKGYYLFAEYDGSSYTDIKEYLKDKLHNKI